MKWSLYSLLLHSIIISSFFLYPNFKPEPQETQVLIISEKELNNLTSQIVKTSKAKTQKDSNQKQYLSDKTNKTDKNQVAGGSPGQQGKVTSITQKGKYSPQEKKGSGVSASDDYIEGAVIGPMTILNTQEFKYYGYYEKIKSKVQETWRPLIKTAITKLRVQKKLTIGVHITKILVTLNEHGEVISVGFVQLSGVELFDRMAVKAFIDAANFPGPPKELIKDNKFFLRWDFTIVVNSSGIIEFKNIKSI